MSLLLKISIHYSWRQLSWNIPWVSNDQAFLGQSHFVMFHLKTTLSILLIAYLGLLGVC